MNNAQDMSPDFVLMRLVSAAEDSLDTEHGTVALGGLGKDVLAHSSGKAARANKGRPSRAASDGGLTEDPAPLSPPSHTPREAQGYEFAPSAGLRPQLLVFSNIIHNGDLILDLDRLNESRNALDQNPGCSGPAVNPLSLQGALQHQDPLDQRWTAHPSAPAETRGAAEPCHRHQILTDPPEWPGLSDTSHPLALITGGREGAVFQLARRFGELGVGSVPKMLFKAGELPQCSCKNAAAESGDDPTETSDALLVLEGLGSGDVDCLDMDQCPEDEADNEHTRQEFLLARKREIAQKMSGAFSISSFQLELRRRVEPDPDQVSPPGSKTKSPTPAQSSPWATSPNPSHASTPRRRTERCASAPRTPTGRATGRDRTLNVHGKSKKVSLRSRLSKLFRTKSCSGSSRLLDKRHSVASSAGSLGDVGPSGAEQDADRWEASCELCSSGQGSDV